jgi:ribonuclease HI
MMDKGVTRHFELSVYLSIDGHAANSASWGTFDEDLQRHTDVESTRGNFHSGILHNECADMLATNGLNVQQIDTEINIYAGPPLTGDE